MSDRINPYAPPIESPAGTASLKSASRTLVILGVLTIIYCAAAGLSWGIHWALQYRSYGLAFIIPMTLAVFIPCYLAVLTQAGAELVRDPASNLRKCRWLAIITGTLFFPWSTLPAYYVLKQLKQVEE